MTFRIPGYQLEQVLGKGSFGEVWSGRRAGDPARVALKIIECGSNEQLDAARSEAALLAALDHPHLIPLVEFLALPRHAVIVQALAEGGSLAALLARRGRLTPPEVAATISPIAAALAYAHDEGVLHCDLSAANILFTAQGSPRLTDLGVARLFGDVTGPIGSPAYLDPAVAAGGPVARASDVFSLAAVALHCLTGSGPWHRRGDETPEELLHAAADGTIPELSQRLAPAPKAMAAAIRRALDVEPFRRGSAADLALELRASVSRAVVTLRAGSTDQGGRHSADRRGLEVAAATDRAASAAGRARHATAGGLGTALVGTDLARETTPARGRRRAAESDDPTRPEFMRPTFLQTGRVPSDLTRVARPRVREEVHDAGLRSRFRSGHRDRSGWLRQAEPRAFRLRGVRLRPARRPARVVSARHKVLRRLVHAAAGGLGFVAVAGVASAAIPHAANGPVASRLAGPAAVSDAAPAPATQPRSQGLPTTVPALLSALRHLDAVRARAFAERDPSSLGQVYGSARLLQQDRDQLLRLVPAGCGLLGVSTRYAEPVHLIVEQNRTEATVSATLRTTVLRCPGQQDRQLPAVGSTRIQLVLARSATADGGQGVVIVSQHEVGG